MVQCVCELSKDILKILRLLDPRIHCILLITCTLIAVRTA